MHETPFEDLRAPSSAIHATSLVDGPCYIGERTAILPFAHVMGHVMIGEDCHIGHRVTVHSGVLVGNRVRLMPNTVIISGVIFEQEAYCGPNTVFSPPRRVRGGMPNLSQVSPTVVRQGASIGPNATIVAGNLLGSFCLVEAGTVVDEPVPDYAVVTGDPLRIKAWRCQCGEVLRSVTRAKLAECDYCGQTYQLKTDTMLVPMLAKGRPARQA